MITFGAGVLIGTQTFDASGAAVSNPSPIQFGVLQEVTPDESFELKKLYGQYKFPVAVAQGKGSMTLKAKVANINAELINTFMYGFTLTSGYQTINEDLVGASIPTGEQITPTVHGTALVDLGVKSAINGVPYTRVATAPTSGQYGFSAGSGLYFFAPQDYQKSVFINYAYDNAAGVTAGKKLVVTNQLMGTQPIFAVDLMTQYEGKAVYIHFPQVISTKLSRAFKNDDFAVYDFDMEAFVDSNNVLYTAYYAE